MKALGVATVIGLVLTVGGAVTLGVAQNSEAIFAADRGEIPDPLTFDASDGRYRITLLRDPITPEFSNEVARLLCTVDLADGTQTTIDGAVALTRAESDLGIEIGSFDAVAGPTTVTCVWKSGIEPRFYFYSVAPNSVVVGIIGGIALALGLILFIGGGALALRSRMRSVTARRPLSEEAKAAGAPPAASPGGSPGGSLGGSPPPLV